MNISSLFSAKTPGDRPNEINYQDLVAALGANSCALVDVREVDEFAAGHVAGAINQPLSSFDPAKLPTGKPIVLMCKAGGRSATALSKAIAAGRKDVVHYPGGAMGWLKEGGQFT